MERYLGDRRRWEADSAFWLGVLPRVAVILLLGLLLTGTGRWLYHSLGMAPPEAPRGSGPPELPRQVAAARVTSRVALGVGSPFAGWVRDIAVRPGQRVTRGQLLFRMDTQALEQKLKGSQDRHRRASARAAAARVARTRELEGVDRRMARLWGQHREWERLSADHAARDMLTPAGFTAAPAILPDPAAALAQVRLALDQARHERKRVYHRHHKVIVAAIREQRNAQQRAVRLRKLIAEAKRFSPINGVVTSLRSAPGAWVSAEVPVVRVDDPQGYRLVLLAHEGEARDWNPGAEFALARENGQTVLERKIPGWGRELFFSWIILRPTAPDLLAPGETVDLRLPAPEQKKAGVASKSATTPA